jgi:signal transduction histidine kinase/ligand-binding sensor domain-containing protein
MPKYKLTVSVKDNFYKLNIFRMYFNYRNAVHRILFAVSSVLLQSIILFFGSTDFIYSQDNPRTDVKFRNITTKDGLSSNSVQCCFMDSRGFIWIGTQCGLNRYDGKSVKVYENVNSDSTSIGDGFIWYIFEDEEHFLWVATNNSGLNKFDPKTEKFIRFKNDPSDNSSISDNTVYCIVEDNDKNLWLSTNKGINKFDRKTGKFTRYIHSETDSNTISFNGRASILKDRNGNIFVGAKFGLNKYIKEKNNFKRIHLAPDDSFSILCVSQDSSGILWLGTQERGIFKYNEISGEIENIYTESGSKNTLASNAIRAIVHRSNGLIWIGHLTEKGGIDVYDTKTNTYYNFKNDKSDDKSLGWDVVWDINIDRQNNLWICTNGGGVSYFSEYTSKFTHIKKLYGDVLTRDLKVVWSVIYNYGRFWCYTEGRILSFSKEGDFIKEYSPAETKLRLFTPLRIGQTSGRMYCGDLDVKLTYYDSTQDKFKPCPLKLKYPAKTYGVTAVMTEDKYGNIWLGASDKGLIKLDKDFNEIDIFDKPDSAKTAFCRKWSSFLYADSEGNLWFGTDGLAKLNTITGDLKIFKPDDKSPHQPAGGFTVSYFYEDGKGNMWISYKGNGLDKLDLKSGTFRHFNVSNGLITNYLQCIFPDKSGNLWFSSAKGIIKYNPEKDVFRFYDTDEGAQDNEFNDDSYNLMSDGMIAFGGVNGINWFYPEKIKMNTHVPPLSISSLRILYNELILPEDISYTEDIELSYVDNFFTIQFAALDYANPEKNRYSYMLEGVDKDWVDAGNKNEAKYTDISPGDYIFKVKGSNNDGVWNEQAKTIKITIVPPWWKRWWFRIFASITILGFIFYGVNKRISVVEKQKASQEEFTRILIGSQEQERKKISAELHDSIGQDIVIIKNNANMALNSIKNDNDAAKFIKQISELSSSALQNVRAISHNLRPVELDRLGLTETIKSIIELVSNSSIIKFESDIEDIDELLDKENEVSFCRIIQESMNNILKHSVATEAFVKINKTGETISTVIRDNGIGFDTSIIKDAPMNSVFGLTGIRERVKMLNGTLEIKSGKGEGTEIIINIPYVKSAKKSV